ncbi:P2R1A-PPP2R2A-interacting phosphatase regulator 1-like isoform X1 [Equus quagga]|uniref:P2R1A-PPP2R2A-interacting phosphatase regulator 1-like isoform X1 n=3 Tax=Equus quagga TaxID=89248 RepID=UPI001EE16B6E|nr:P2R1A-PPP2R2A-interacting phosphatase regulator 1-like isoform X1 [Equus quagga]
MAHFYGTEKADHETQLDQADVSLCEWEPENVENSDLNSGFSLDTDMPLEKMELDLELQPSSSTTDGSILRRSNSAPVINGLGDNSQMFQADTLRARGNSITSITQHCMEEGMDLINREAMRTWEVQTAIQIGQPWKENSNLDDESSAAWTTANSSDSNLEKPASPKCFDLSPAASPPMGIEQLCSSTSSQTCMSCTGSPLAPVANPMEEFAIRRSQSPTNTITPSILGPLKRKAEMAFEDQPKRFFQGPTDVLPSDTNQVSDMNAWEKSWPNQI